MSGYSQCFWENSYLFYNDTFNIQLYLINNSNELTKAFRFSNHLNLNIHSICQSPMSRISIWSYQESKHDVPGQTSQNSQGLKSNWYQQWKEPSWNARNLQDVPTRGTCTCRSISWVYINRTFSCSRIPAIHVMAYFRW